MVTTKGRLLEYVSLTFINDEITIYGATLEDDETLAFLIDHWHNRARLYAPLHECERLASLHRYEIFLHDEALFEYLERVMSTEQAAS